MASTTKKIKAVFFDLGFTLIYFSGDFYQSLLDSYLVMADEIIKCGYSIDRFAFARAFDNKMQDYYRQRQQDFLERPVDRIVREILAEQNQTDIPDEICIQAMQAMYRTTEANWLLEEDTHEMLHQLLDQHYKLGLISNASSSWDVNNLIDNYDLRPYFSTILISADEGIRKPNPLLFARAAERMNVTPAESVMVGDTLAADVLGAHRAGMRSIWISRRKDTHALPAESSPEMTPDAEIHSLRELPALLTAWNNA
jgi:haloacid dehalogenase superfamily, subfamily IA, variant 3 with third motif having DD or ED/haloacid dehalogenase superfamily, subfamily IA, variant 1 with third motif having Dx(3-4)D or Dx(3-4)E